MLFALIIDLHTVEYFFFPALPQALSREFKKPLITVHHLEAHCLVARLAGQLFYSSAGSTLPPPVSATDHANKKADQSQLLPPNPTSPLPHNADASVTDLVFGYEPRVKYPFLVLLVSGE